MNAAAWFTLGVLCTLMAGVLISLACCRKTEPDPERRTRTTDRRRRNMTAANINKIAEQYHSGALTYPQACARLRAHEAPSDIARRVLEQQK